MTCAALARQSLPLLLLLGLVFADGAGSAFSSGSPVCTTDLVVMNVNHGSSSGTVGSYRIEVRRSGIPVTSVFAGETVQVVITNPQNAASKGFILRAQLGNAAGAGVGGLVAGSGQQIMVGCTPSGSGLTHTSAALVPSPRTANWIVPNTLTPGQNVFFSALVLEAGFSSWSSPTPVTVSIAAPAAVPSLGLVSLATAVAGLSAFAARAAWRSRRA